MAKPENAATDGKSYNTQHYKLAATIAVGYKVNPERAVQFRQWATGIIHEYTLKGFAMDDERLKNDGRLLGKKYFEEQLQRIREIVLSERKFYQKITDIYAAAIDYAVTAQAAQRVFPPYTISCTALFMGKRQQRWFIAVLMHKRKKRAWPYEKMRPMARFKNLTSVWQKLPHW